MIKRNGIKLIVTVLLVALFSALFLHPVVVRQNMSEIIAEYIQLRWFILRRNGGDELATVTIPWTLKSNGSTYIVNLSGKTVISARLRFRGVGTSTVEYKTNSRSSFTGPYGGGSDGIDVLSFPSVPSGYTFDSHTVSISVSTSGGSGNWWCEVMRAGIGVLAQNSGTGTSGTANGTTYTNLVGSPVEFWASHANTFTMNSALTTRGKKTTTTASENPSCGGASYSGSLADGVTSGWYSVSLTSDTSNTLSVSVGGSGQVYIELEYTTKDAQPAPSTPSVSDLTPTSAVLTSSAGSMIVCNGQTKPSGSTWTGLSERTTYSAYAYFPETETHERSPNSGSVSFSTPSSAGPPSVQTRPAEGITFTTATISGNISSANGDTPERFLRWGYSADEMVFVIHMGVGTGTYSIELFGLEPGQTYYYQAYATNIYGTSNGAVLSFDTPYPILEAPVPDSPDNGDRIQDRRPWLIFTLTPHPDNPAEKHHARARISEYSTMSPVLYELDSASGIGNWEYWDGTAWLAFPPGGVAPGTRVRCRTDLEMPYRAFYWDCAAHDGVMWGQNSLPWTFRVLIAVSRTFTLVINDQDVVGVKDIVASETCNGEIGEISFSLDNKQGQADEINYNDLVILGINDKLNNVDEFRALVREKVPQQGKLMRLTCTTGDGILAERIVKQDYPAQDIGLSLKHAIDTYGAPLTSASINTNTGIVAELKSKDKTLLQMFEEVRRDYNQFYRVDNDWDVSTYFESDIEQAIVQIQYGANGITLMGGM